MLQALAEGLSSEDEVFYRVRDLIGCRKLTAKLRRELVAVGKDMVRRQRIANEEGEYFLLPQK